MENNLDVNILIKTFSDRINQMTSDLIVKDAMIAQLTMQLESLKKGEHLSVEEKEIEIDEEFK